MRRCQWVVEDVAGRTVYITVEVDEEVAASAFPEIRALMAALRLERWATPSGFRLVFETQGGWDSG